MPFRRGSVADVSVRIHSSERATASSNNSSKSDVHDTEECLVWQFELEEYDIGFHVLANGVPMRDVVRYKANEVGFDASAATDAADSDALSCVEDALESLAADTTYTLRWDNSYSLVRHKRLRYRFLVTSKRAFAAAAAAAQDTSVKRLNALKTQRWADTSVRPHVARALAQQRTLSPQDAAIAQRDVVETLKQCVTDLVASFMMRPDSPLHEGSVRAFVLALETVLRHGIKVHSLSLEGERERTRRCLTHTCVYVGRVPRRVARRAVLRVPVGDCDGLERRRRTRRRRPSACAASAAAVPRLGPCARVPLPRAQQEAAPPRIRGLVACCHYCGSLVELSHD